jgi:Tol biopolymer transport system component
VRFAPAAAVLAAIASPLVLGASAAESAYPSRATPSLIVFARTVGDHQGTFSVRPDGSGVQRLSSRREHETEPALSPDGRLIAAVGGPGIVVRTRTGRLVRRIPVRVGSQLTEPSWSPGGRWIAFLAERCQSDDNRDPSPLCADLWLVRPNGLVRRRLVEANVHTNDLVATYAWSPNGQSIVFERYEKASLAIVDVRTRAIRTVRGTLRFGSDPDWARGGWIIFARQRGAFKGSDLYAVRPTGRGLHRVCRAEHAERPVSSRDGKEIAFLDYRPRSGLNLWDVKIVGRGGAHCRRVGTATEEWTLSWSPEGTRILWENFEERLMIGHTDGRGRPRLLARGSLADWR